MVINHNISALNIYRNLTQAQSHKSIAMERLSTGLRINRSADDPAGLAISERMRAQIRGLEQASRNAQDSISMLQTAEGGLNETHSILQRMRELAVQASTDTLSKSDRDAIAIEISQLINEIDNIGNSTKYNTKSLLNGTLGAKRSDSSTLDNTIAGIGSNSDIDVSGAKSGVTYIISATAAAGMSAIKLLNGTTGASYTLSAIGDGAQTLDFGSMGIKIKLNNSFVAADLAMEDHNIIVSGNSTVFQIGPDQGQTMSVSINDMTSIGLSLSGIDVSTNSKAQSAIGTLDDAIGKISVERAKIGASINRLEHSIEYMNTSADNLTEAESRIRDADMAKEMMDYIKYSILEKAATAMLAQANQQPQVLLKILLQGL
ncbi:MAG: flagellin [Ignavibacteriales bacterium]